MDPNIIGILVSVVLFVLWLLVKLVSTDDDKAETQQAAKETPEPSPKRNRPPLKARNVEGQAETMGAIPLDENLVRRMRPNISEPALEKIREHMIYGDCAPAVVINEDPPIVAIYSDEFDANYYLMGLQEDAKILSENGYCKRDSLMVAVLTYTHEPVPDQNDIRHGSHSCHRFEGIYPILAELVCSDHDHLDRIATHIQEEMPHKIQRCFQIAGHDSRNPQGILMRAMDPVLSFGRSIPVGADDEKEQKPELGEMN